VNFTGGEAFLLQKELTGMVRAVAERNMAPAITTSAYWSPNSKAALSRLAPLAQAGLKQLVISCSDAHREFVPLDNVIEAARAAASLNIAVILNVTVSKISTTNSRSIREAFEGAGVTLPWLYVTQLIPFGRYADNVEAGELLVQKTERFAGPCPSLTTHPTVHNDGCVTGCAVVYGREQEQLTYGNVYEQSMETILDRMNSDPLAVFIHTLGVCALKDLIEHNTGIRFETEYANICHLCGDILGNEQALRFLTDNGLLPRHLRYSRPPSVLTQIAGVS
jgi:MoaA/NifB/PqqE/SkfB family radical SAM enzyme